MNSKYLIWGTILIVGLVFLIYKRCTPQGNKNSITMYRLLKEETPPNGRRVVMTKQMSKGEVEHAIEGFVKLHAENESLVERPLIRQVDEDKFLINFSDTTDYGLFCYWVNYIVYSNKEKRYNSNVTGWYEVGADAKGVWEQFANQKLMFYVPESDTECDNVYITTEDNVCYKQEFAWQALLIQQNTVYRKYADMP